MEFDFLGRWLLTERYSFLRKFELCHMFNDQEKFEQRLALSSNSVQVWIANLKVSKNYLQTLSKTLSFNEHERADKFLFEKDKEAFIVSRGTLRVILSKYLDLEPKQIKFSYSNRGKPSLSASQNSLKLEFNLSHAHELVIYAITFKKAIGIDLEHHRAIPDLLQLAKNFFTYREYELIKSLPIEEQQSIFFRLWTCKEAYLKATGEGLTELQNTQLVFDYSQPFEPIGLQISSQSVPSWCLVQFQPKLHYTAALAVQYPYIYLTCNQLTEKLCAN